MPCCGKGRAQVTKDIETPKRNGASSTSGNEPTDGSAVVYFKYTGRTGLTVLGRETRKRYRFDNPGAVVAVDARDRIALSAVPNLKQVKR
jgi:hypothetical protein